MFDMCLFCLDNNIRELVAEGYGFMQKNVRKILIFTT